jgi:hypothetical protein
VVSGRHATADALAQSFFQRFDPAQAEPPAVPPLPVKASSGRSSSHTGRSSNRSRSRSRSRSPGHSRSRQVDPLFPRSSQYSFSALRG